MVLGWSNGENIVIKEILGKIATLENKVKLLEKENAAQKEEISALRNGNAGTDGEMCLLEKRKIYLSIKRQL
jgi:phage shock protein A